MDRHTFTRWAWGVTIVYSLTALVLIGLIAGRSILTERATTNIVTSAPSMEGSLRQPVGNGESPGARMAPSNRQLGEGRGQ